MSEILIFGGTTEGHRLSEYCMIHQIEACVCVASDYGSSVLEESPYLDIRQGRMDKADMRRLLRREKPRLIFDATHPHAVEVSNNIKEACDGEGCAYYRVLRPQSDSSETGDIHVVSDVLEAVSFLKEHDGDILLATGSKELASFTDLTDYENRIYVRVLPDAEVIHMCSQMGLKGKHLIAMQGPFTEEMNLAMLHTTKARWLVTKESGSAGGYEEKINAAKAAGAGVLVIGRPDKECGIAVEEAFRLIKEEVVIYAVGIGMGDVSFLTTAAKAAISQSKVIFGAERMLEAVSELTSKKTVVSTYQSEDIVAWLREHREYDTASVVYSGDVGFYSGADTLAKTIESETDAAWKLEMIPGISSLSYLCARLKKPWQDVFCASMHGRQCDIETVLKSHERVLILLGGNETWRTLCEKLQNLKTQKLWIAIGENLSYPNERIIVGRLEEVSGEDVSNLSVVLIERRG